MGGISEAEFFDACGWDPIMYVTPHRPDPARGEYFDPDQGEPGFLESRRIATDNWRVLCEVDFRAGASYDPLPIRYAEGHVKHGFGGRSATPLGWSNRS